VLDMTARIDFEETRRRFQLAREQAAAGASVEHYGRARAARRWPALGSERATERREVGNSAAEADRDRGRRAA
jgi:hypothetical protein